jgi:hypothetical protein
MKIHLEKLFEGKQIKGVNQCKHENSKTAFNTEDFKKVYNNNGSSVCKTCLSQAKKYGLI